MTAKARDGQGRWRSITIAFRISPQENEELNKLVAISGMTKQDYIMNRLANRDVVVVGNPRVYKALKNNMEQLYFEFSRLCDASETSVETRHVLQYLAEVYDRMQDNGTILS